MLAILLGGFASPVQAADPDAASPLASYIYLDTLADAPSQPNVASVLVSYLYQDSLSPPPNQPNVVSSLVSYLFQDSLATSPLQPNVVSPLVSYLYFDWPGDENLTFQNSPLVSYLYQAGTGGVVIHVPPESQFVQSGANATFLVIAGGQQPLSYQWRFNGIDRMGSTGSTLTISNVGSLQRGKYSVVVSNSFGLVVSQEATLAVLADPANGVAPAQPTYSSLPPKQHGKDGVIIVTHGWQPWPRTPDFQWLDDLATTISSNVPGNWQVVSYRWARAWTGAWTVYPQNALANGYSEGGKVGQDIVNQGWDHVHLIGHSASAGLIEAAIQTIKSKPAPPTIHATFLDPFSDPSSWRSVYGAGADWSDHYFSRDFLTGAFTEGALQYAFNVDVTARDPGARDILISGDCGLTACGTQKVSSHEWPYAFYQTTITNSTFAPNYGFARSKEGGGWDSRENYPINMSTNLDESPPIQQGTIPVLNYGNLTLNERPVLASDTGTVQINVTGIDFSTILTLPPSPLTLDTKIPTSNADGESTNQPVWLSIGITVTNPVNFISFETQFTSATNAAGLLTVYWNTNQIGFVDERIALPRLQQYTLGLPGTYNNGNHILGFRLDPFTNVVSSATITNINFGFSGLSEPLSLAVSMNPTNGFPTLLLSGAAGFNYVVEGSTNLMDWTPTAIVTNTNGIVQFTDLTFTNAMQRFYRAVSR